jgi:hypothetical protein
MLVIATGKVAVNSATPTQIVAARGSPNARTQLYLSPDTPGLFYGPDNTVTRSNGYPLTGINQALERILGVAGAIWAIGASGNVTFMEIYDNGL